MCKHIVLSSTRKKDAVSSKLACQTALIARVWRASRRALSLEHAHPHIFSRCQWQRGLKPPTAYIVYRWLLLLFLFSVCITSFATQSLPPNYEGPMTKLNHLKWFIYLTNWGMMLYTLQASLAIAVVHRYRAAPSFSISSEEHEVIGSCQTRTPLMCKAYWLAHTVATDLAFIITLIYWTLVHDPAIHELNALNFMVHGANSASMLVELTVTSHPFRPAHALYAIGVGALYGCFSAIYYAFGGTDRLGHHTIYPSLDWSRPGVAFSFVALASFILCVAHTFATIITHFRSRLATKLLDNKSLLSDRLTQLTDK